MNRLKVCVSKKGNLTVLITWQAAHGKALDLLLYLKKKKSKLQKAKQINFQASIAWLAQIHVSFQKCTQQMTVQRKLCENNTFSSSWVPQPEKLKPYICCMKRTAPPCCVVASFHVSLHPDCYPAGDEWASKVAYLIVWLPGASALASVVHRDHFMAVA